MRPGLRRAATLVLLSAWIIALAGCGVGQDESASQGGDTEVAQTRVDLDTPRLRKLKRQAGVESCPSGTAEPIPGDDGLPELTLPCLGGGRAVNLATLRGPLVLNLWASWCSPCREELPYYQRLHEEYGGRLQVIGVDYEDMRPEAALQLLQETGATYPQLADPGGRLKASLGVRGLPGVVFVGADGRVRAVKFLAVDSYGQLKDLVAQHLDVDL